MKTSNIYPYFLSLIFILSVSNINRMMSFSNTMEMNQDAFTISFTDEDGDDDPDVANIRGKSSFGEYKIMIYDNQDIFVETQDIKNTQWYEDTVWVFDVVLDGSPDFIIRFHKDENGNYFADGYDDINNDGIINFNIVNKEFNILEGPSPKISVFSKGFWWLTSGYLNWNFTIFLDGNQVEQIYTFEFSRLWKDYLVYDGSPDVSLEFTDNDLDGIPESGVWRLLTDAPEITLPIGKTFLWKNVGLKKPKNTERDFIWPLLVDTPESAEMYFDAFPYFQIDWSNKKIANLRFDGYPIEAGFHVNTFQKFIDGENNYANFENMQAYYDIALDQDGFPELHARVGYFEEDDPILHPGINIENIRYSWNLTNESGLHWDYKLDLMGRHKLNGVEKFPDFGYVTIPYSDLLAWITNNNWDMADFVSVQSGNYQSSEGIYEPIVIESDLKLWDYLGGRVNDNPLLGLESLQLPNGLRAELAPYIGGKVFLYYSPVDKLLHLFKSSYGLWRINQLEEIHLEDINKDGFIDHWIYLLDGEITQGLLCISNQIIYYDHHTGIVDWKKGICKGELFAPPQDHNSWENMRALQERYGLTVTSLTPLQIYDGFFGESWRINGAKLSNLRSTELGYRFVLTLYPGYSLTGNDWLGVKGTFPGDYLIEFSDSFTINPLTPAQVKIDFKPVYIGELKTRKQIPIQVDLTNTGLEDVNNAFVIIEAHNGSKTAQIISQTVDLNSQQQVSLATNWLPSKDGVWQLITSVRDQNGLELDQSRSSILISKGSTGSPREIAWASGHGYQFPILLLLLVSAFFSMVVFLSAWANHN